jgi:hypothetical protein
MSDSLKRLGFLVQVKLGGFFAESSRRGYAGLTSFTFVLCLLLVSRVTYAQSSTATTLTATADGPVSGSIVTMTANVSSGGQPVSGGSITFRDTFAGATQDLGTVQVQSANGTPGLAILKTEVGGVGAHSIVAIYRGRTGYSTSTSAPAALTFQAPYSSATALAITGSGGTFTLTGTLSAFGPIQPTGSVTFSDITTNTTIGTVPLDSSTATQGFTPPMLYQIPTESPWGTYSTGTPVSGDFNGDGRPDFVIPTSLGAVIVMLGHGDGTFQQGASISAIQPFGAVAADFNGDGKLDVAVANRGPANSIAIYLGNGDGTFQAGDIYPAVPNADYQIVGSGDFNGDGNPDLVVSDHANNQVAVYLGNGDGTFREAGLFATGPQPWNLVVGDINSDGNPDLVVADDQSDAQGKNITLLLGNGDGTFSQGTYLKGGVTSSGSVALADFNGDGKLDIAATEEPANSVFVFLGNGDGTFQAETTYQMQPPTDSTHPCTPPGTCGPYHISIGDFNQDGKNDIITANAEGESITVLIGNGDGTFQNAKMYPGGGPAIYANVHDFNGDDQVDVVTVTNHGLQVYLAGNAQTAQFSPFTVTGCGTHSIVATYSSDANYAASTSPVQSVSQNGLSTAISVVQTPANAVWGQAVTLTATLTPYVNGSNSSDGMDVNFFDGTINIGTGKLSGGVASVTLTSLATGPHSFTAVFGGDCTSFTGSTSVAILETVGKATPTITWPNPGPIPYGTSLSATQLNATASVAGTFTYTPAVGAVPAAGTDNLSVTFTPADTDHYTTATTTVPITVTQGALLVTADNAARAYGAANPTFTGSITGAVPGDTITESFTTTATDTSAPGTYAIVPSGVGPNVANYTQSVTNGILTVTQASATVSITAIPAAASPSQAVSLSAAVVSSTTGTPTGTVTFLNNGTPLGTATLTGGTATYAAGTLPLGNNVITASYSGDTNFTSANASPVTVTVAQNVLNIMADDKTRVYGASDPAFTGKITGAQNVDTFTETFTTTATPTSAPGKYPIVPSATGTNLAQYQQAVTNGTLTITQAAVSKGISLSAASITQGQSETLTASVKSTTIGTPTGTVTFFSGSTQLGTATLTNGTASYATTSLPVGNDVITFTYSGDTNFAADTAGQTSGTNTVIVSPPPALDFTFTISNSTALSGVYGGSVPVTLHIAPTAGQYPDKVQFAISGTPAVAAQYSFSPATIAATDGAKDVIMTIQIQAFANLNRAPATSGRLVSIALGLLFLPWVAVRRMRKTSERLGKSMGLSALFLALLGAALSITGCGGGSSPTVPGTTNQPVADSIVVNATSGSVQHSVTVNLTVQKSQ